MVSNGYDTIKLIKGLHMGGIGNNEEHFNIKLIKYGLGKENDSNIIHVFVNNGKITRLSEFNYIY
jgi:hypothetical protein